VVRIDYSNGKLDVFLPQAHQPADGAVEVPVEEVAGHYAVRATLKGPGGKSAEGKFVLDVGVRLPLIVNTPFVNRHGLIEALGAKTRATVGGGLGGEVVHHLARLESIQIDKLEIPAPYVTLSQERTSALATDAYQGLLGAEVFRRYRLTLDFPGKRVFFEETALAKAPYEFDMSGMFVVAGGEDFRTFTVFSVTPGGPADEAGVQKGDVLAAVDDLPAAKWTLESLRASFREAGATRALALERAGERKAVKIKLRRLV
jgi:PDZ domain